jgi:hypothetical protein
MLQIERKKENYFDISSKIQNSRMFYFLSCSSPSLEGAIRLWGKGGRDSVKTKALVR